MTKIIERVLLAVIAALGVVMVFSSFWHLADANPSQFLPQKSATASTTLSSYMTAGAATTTAAFDTQADGGLPTASAWLAIQFNASSTNTMYRIRYEYADNTFVNGAFIDCTANPNQCDWYSLPITPTITLTQTATTTPFQVASAPMDIGFLFASSSQGAALVTSDNNRALRLFEVATPMRYVRALISLAPGSTNGAVWTEWMGKKEIR